MDEEPKYLITIFYDGACGIFRKEIKHYRAKDKNAGLKFINANHPNCELKSEGLNPEKFLNYTYAKDINGEVIYGIYAFALIWEACGYKFFPFSTTPSYKTVCPCLLQIICTVPL